MSDGIDLSSVFNKENMAAITAAVPPPYGPLAAMGVSLFGALLASHPAITGAAQAPATPAPVLFNSQGQPMSSPSVQVDMTATAANLEKIAFSIQRLAAAVEAHTAKMFLSK
jgi:hypothetical protein